VTREEALQALGLELSVSPAEIENALLEKVTQLEKRLTTAPTEALKDKYRRQLAEIEEARTVLLSGASVGGLSQTKLADLPLAQAAYTRGTGTGPRSNTGIALSPGQTLADRYELHEQIGAGGMGAVFSAYDRNRDKDIAIKVLLPQMLSSPKARERFLREARLASEMSHPNIATVFDVQQDGVYCFLTMELLHGQSLRTYLKNLKGLRKDMAVDDALRIVSQVCEALAYAHEKTVHRDIKPENIWLTEDGKAKVMDFGIALLTNSTQVLETMMSAGTPYYMAPEQLAGLSSVDGRVDQYAIAVMLYEMLSGQVPTGRIESLKKVRKDVPAAVSNAVDKALSQKPADRYGSIKEFQTALSKSGISAHAKNVKLIGSVISGLALVGILVGTFPSWKGLLPDRAAEASAKQEAARLEGEAKSLMKLVEAQSREIKDAVSKNSRDVERLQSQLRSARSTSERQELESSLHTAQRLAELTDELNSRVKSRMEGSNGLPTIDGKMNAAQLLLKNGNANAAIAAFTEIVDSVKALQSFPAEERNKLLAARMQETVTQQGFLPVCPSSKPTYRWDDCIGTVSYKGGETYIGRFKVGKKNGQGTYTWSNGEKYVGEFKNDKMNGQGIYTYSNGEKYVGQFKDEKSNGQGTYTWPNGEKYVGEFKNDKMNGQGIYTYSNGEKYVGQFKDEKSNGQGTLTWPNGEKYVGEFKNDKRNGIGTQFDPRGATIYQGKWENDRMTGK
jgi:serine/threonine protein kinase